MVDEASNEGLRSSIQLDSDYALPPGTPMPPGSHPMHQRDEL